MDEISTDKTECVSTPLRLHLHLLTASTLYLTWPLTDIQQLKKKKKKSFIWQIDKKKKKIIIIEQYNCVYVFYETCFVLFCLLQCSLLSLIRQVGIYFMFILYIIIINII